MKTKTKILLTILPVLIIGVISINIAFGLFFKEFILSSEKDSIHASADFISMHLNERTANYARTVNDWAHWDDTYYFVETLDRGYVDSNLTDNAIQDIDIHVMFFLNSEGSVVHQLFYDAEEETITQFPPDLLEDRDRATRFSMLADDTSGIIQMGDSYYFVASSHITDSLMKEDANGTLIIGRQIDSQTIAQMEMVSGFSISGINVLNDSTRLNQHATSNALEIVYDEQMEKPINVEITIPNTYDLDYSIIISAVIPRDLYIDGMKQAFEFSILNTIASLIVIVFIFLLIGKYITKPFNSLINDVKSIQLSNTEIYTIPEGGKDEFSFLRKSINTLMHRIMTSQKELIKSREEFHTTLMSIGEGIITVDKRGLINFMNPVAEKMTGWKLEESLNKQLETVLFIMDEKTGKPVGNPTEAVFETETTIELSNNILLFTKNGTALDIEVTATPIKDSNGSISGCVLVVDDVTENKKKQKHIEYLSYRDTLTGLYNRRFYEEKLKEYEENSRTTASIIAIDVNGLKLTNDAFGHETGDRLLVKVAECIKYSFRFEDIICRTGGDEFVIILPRADAAEATRIIKRMHETIEKETIENIPISISSGWATKQQNGEKMEVVFKRAEDMMYHNKSAENNSLRHQTIQIIMKTLFEKNPREEAHSKRVSEHCSHIGEQMEMDSSKIKNLQTAGLLHDIGKIGIGNSILDKAGPLSKEEWREVKKHPKISYNILSSVNDYGPLADIILSHHERWDGTGYPSGLKGEEIPLESRVIALADAFDAMVSDRPYRRGMTEDQALEIVAGEAGRHFDPAIVSVFVEKVMKNEN